MTFRVALLPVLLLGGAILGAACGGDAQSPRAPAAGEWSADTVSLRYGSGLGPGDVSFAGAAGASGCICGAAIDQASGLRAVAQRAFPYRASAGSGLSVAIIDTSGDAALRTESSDRLPDSELLATAALLGVPRAAPAGGSYEFTRLRVAGLSAGRVDIGRTLSSAGELVDQTHWIVLNLEAGRIYQFECQFASDDGRAVASACDAAVASFVVK